MMNRVFGSWGAMLLCVLSIAAPCAGTSVGNAVAIQQYSVAPGTQIVVFNIYSEHSGVRLDRQAVVKLVRLADQSATWQITESTSRSVFRDVIYGRYEVEVNAVGYFALRQQLTVMRTQGSMEVEILMHRDPTVIDLDIAHTIMSPKARKEAKRVISLLKSGDLDPVDQ
jgi:hypothetical protein